MPDPLFSPLALILIPLGYLSLWPLICRFTARHGDTAFVIESALLAFTLSPALTTVILFWIGIAPVSWITPLTVLIIVLALWAISLSLNPTWLRSLPLRSALATIWNALRRLDVTSLMLWTLIGACWLMLIHALYYPFFGDDALSRYAPYAKEIYLSHRIAPTITGYPPLVPMVWVSTWFAAGHINEHLARTYSVLLTIGTLGATYLLGHEVGGRRLGITAALLQTLSPVFFLFGTVDMVDVPTALPLTLLALYMIRWWKTGLTRHALLAGLLFAVAMLTKQSALTWAASLVALIVLGSLNAIRNSRFNWRQFIAITLALLAPVLLIAAPWYIRNRVFTGLWFPVSGLWHILGAQAGMLGVLPPVARADDFGYHLVLIYSIGWVIGIIRAVREGFKALLTWLDTTPTHLLLGLCVVPYWLVWWYSFSFEAHYLLLITPIMAIWAAEALIWLLDQFNRRIQLPAFVVRTISAITLLALLFLASRGRYGGIYYALTDPFASEAERLHRVQPVLSDMILYVKTHMDHDDQILVMDGRMGYYLPDYQLSPGLPMSLSDVEGYDYLIHASGLYGIYDGRLNWDKSEFFLNIWNPQYFEPIYETNGVHIMRILPQGESR